MSTYFETWVERSETIKDQTSYQQYIKKYYSLETNAYDMILKAYPDNKDLLSGKADEMAKKLGFTPDTMEIFVGFLDGINTSLKEEIDVKSIDDNTMINIDIDYEKLYYNMRDAKAEWLYGLSAWNKVLSKEKIDEIAHRYREDNIVHSTKIGRNDPCPCGSGKKYKKCCGKNS